MHPDEVVKQAKCAAQTLGQACTNMPSHAVAPPGIWLCKEHYFYRIMQHLLHPQRRLFPEHRDLSIYATVIDVLGANGMIIPANAQATSRLYRNGVVSTREHGDIWYGDVSQDKLDTLRRQLSQLVQIQADEIVEPTHKLAQLGIVC